MLYSQRFKFSVSRASYLASFLPFSNRRTHVYLGFDPPSSLVVALAMRHAMLRKQYSSEYKLYCEWGTYGVPENLFTDGGKDFRSEHLKQIGFQLGFECHLRDRPPEGGIEERGFGTIKTDFLSGFYGYLGSNIQERPEGALVAEEDTLRQLWELMAEKNTPLINELLLQVGKHPGFETWLEEGKIPTELLKTLVNSLKTQERFAGQSGRFYTTASFYHSSAINTRSN
ncbi:hypothetical protein A6769_26795 [Nostoc punctiforme NIES-2108]|uniref:Integrase catalytic domain-containing protein n=1 Tax=Nostoc punctiforme NIES-2108 TaxID=1356359 RepID=A0A367R9H1_NOSPU|nr:hypothetical protein A6769_26795 [Nostoc punctiforme NIES-2108]